MALAVREIGLQLGKQEAKPDVDFLAKADVWTKMCATFHDPKVLKKNKPGAMFKQRALTCKFQLSNISMATGTF